jgi:hypothetical protein
MRPALLVTVVSAWLLASLSAGCESRPVPVAVKVKSGTHSRGIKQFFVGSSPAFQEQSWTIQGKQTAPAEVAKADALEQAQAKVIEYLLDQDPPITWAPPISFVKRELVKDINVPENGEDFKGVEPKILPINIDRHQAFEEIWETKDPVVKDLHRVSLNVTITQQAWQKILEEQHKDLQRQRTFVMNERMLFLLKFLGGLILLLATVAGYIRLDEWSKGYYTNWLRLAALSCVGGVVAAGWWLFLAN